MQGDVEGRGGRGVVTASVAGLWLGNCESQKTVQMKKKTTWKAKDTPIFKATGLLVLGVFSCLQK